MIAIVGAVDRKQAEKIAEQLTADLAEGNEAKPLTDVKALEKAETVVIDHPSTQTHILVGQPGLKRGDVDYFPLYVGNHVLGGDGYDDIKIKNSTDSSVSDNLIDEGLDELTGNQDLLTSDNHVF